MNGDVLIDVAVAAAVIAAWIAVLIVWTLRRHRNGFLDAHRVELRWRQLDRIAPKDRWQR